MKKILVLVFSLFLIQFVYATTDDYVDMFCFKNMIPSSQIDGVEIIDGSLQLLPGCTQGYWISEIMRTQINFNGISLNYLGEMFDQTNIKIFIRALNQDGNWSEWQYKEGIENDFQFDYQSIAYQFKVELSTQNQAPKLSQLSVNYDVVNEQMLGAGVVTTRVEEMRAVPKPTIVSRSGWGARSPNGSYSSHTPQKITIHHTWRPTAADYNGASTIRSIQNYHMDTNGWMDIGYHFLIGTYPSSGATSIYQGRPETAVGAHTGGANTNNVGVNVVGDYTTESLHNNSYQSLIKLLGWLCSNYKISPDNIYGHKDFNSTACPGPIIYNKMAQIRQDVRNYINGGGGDDTGKLIGVIYDAQQGTSAKISGATVKLSSGHSMTTGTDGIYSFQLPVGTYTINVQKSGYQSASSSDVVQKGETTWESIGLKK